MDGLGILGPGLVLHVRIWYLYLKYDIVEYVSH